MRTGTKFAGLLVLWAVTVITALIVWLIKLGDHPVAAKVWPNLPTIITAILGPSGLNMCVNEVRKALENGGLNIFGRKVERKGEDEKPC